MRLGRLAIDAGIVEVKLFWLRSRLASTVKFPNESGIEPVRRLSLRANTLSRVRLPSSTGICPSNLLSPSSKTATTDNKFKPSASSSHHSIVLLMISIPNKLRSEINVNYCSDLGGMEWWMGVYLASWRVGLSREVWRRREYCYLSKGRWGWLRRRGCWVWCPIAYCTAKTSRRAPGAATRSLECTPWAHDLATKCWPLCLLIPHNPKNCHERKKILHKPTEQTDNWADIGNHNSFTQVIEKVVVLVGVSIAQVSEA